MSSNTQNWSGAFGNEYTERNRAAKVGGVEANIALFEEILNRNSSLGPRARSVLEFGAGIGNNLRALHALLPMAELSAVELNVTAADSIPEIVATIITGSVTQFATTTLQPVDLVLTKGLLIHIPPFDLPLAYDAIYQTSRRYVLVCEYFCPEPRMIPYRGQDNMLWARDFAGEMMDAYPDLQLVDYGFAYKRTSFPQDNINWFLMEKS